jgi:hypothetical protein
MKQAMKLSLENESHQDRTSGLTLVWWEICRYGDGANHPKIGRGTIKFSLRPQKFSLENSTNITEFIQGIQLSQFPFVF